MTTPINRDPSLPPLYLYLLEYCTKAGLESTYITGGCVEEVIDKFRKEGFNNEIYHIMKSKVQSIIY